MAETDFLSLLVDETLKLQKSGEAELSRFELKLTDYKLKFLKGVFIPQLQMLRFKTSFGIIDIPINWSVFSLDTSMNSEHMVDGSNDGDRLLEVLKSAWEPKLDQLLITHADGFCYIVGLMAGEEFYLHDLLSHHEFLKAA